ncbi:histidine phosphatase family protein [Oceanirhabdus sp. W0125-5]|uniref:histidine phosphatase family protein n=1 Tax=Oceanirhabdus sp. W0125-5 TaxID=2999116 RepID=UPI0022F2BDDC|nr:histidine phosphatase family protein [Oceanirhabdus sp. W0125-5]WBW96487.1 histidine phosphatase family protein [Oceanirhabdus sp. W0125-5]
MLEIIVARHGQSVADIENRLEGKADFPLTELGIEQAEKLARWLKFKYKFDDIYSSPLKRASKVAEIIGEKFEKEITYDERLKEMDNGVLAGLLREEADRLYPLPEGGRKYYEHIPDGESLIELRARAEHFFAELIHSRDFEKENKRILIVSHGGLISMLYRAFLNLPVDTGVWLSTGDTGVHVWRVSGKNRIVVASNVQYHLK